MVQPKPESTIVATKTLNRKQTIKEMIVERNEDDYFDSDELGEFQ